MCILRDYTRELFCCRFMRHYRWGIYNFVLPASNIPSVNSLFCFSRYLLRNINLCAPLSVQKVPRMYTFDIMFLGLSTTLGRFWMLMMLFINKMFLYEWREIPHIVCHVCLLSDEVSGTSHFHHAIIPMWVSSVWLFLVCPSFKAGDLGVSPMKRSEEGP